jgi:hypothetical protein
MRVLVLVCVCGGSVECRVSRDIRNAQAAASCYTRITGIVPATLVEVTLRKECNLLIVPTDRAGRDLLVIAEEGRPRVVTAEGGLLPPPILCMVGPFVGIGAALAAVGFAVSLRGAKRHRRRLVLIGLALVLSGLALGLLGPVG